MPAIPPKLRPGSLVRVIAPSRSLAIIAPDVRAEADRKLAALGLRVSFAQHVGDCDEFSSSSVPARLADLHAAFADPDVDGILTVIGGFNANQGDRQRRLRPHHPDHHIPHRRHGRDPGRSRRA